MFKISIKIQMPNFDRHEIEIECPICRLNNWVRLGEIRRRDFSVCQGCHANLLLEDHLGSLQRTIREIENSFKDMV